MYNCVCMAICYTVHNIQCAHMDRRCADISYLHNRIKVALDVSILFDIPTRFLN